jgi:class II lanthipeptide synthase
MDSFYDRLITRAATIDELLSDDFETLPGQKGDADAATKRLAAWCRSCASGDWLLFSRRLERDKLAIDQVLARFATIRRRVCAPPPAWIDDAIWIEAALQGARNDPAAIATPFEGARCAFEHLFTPVVEQAESRLWASVEMPASDNLNTSARACLRYLLLDDLCDLCAPAIYERFVKARQASTAPVDAAQPAKDGATAGYDRFIVGMRTGGLRRLFEDKPILLRLISLVTRQWIDTSREFVTRLDADLATIRRTILHSDANSVVAKIEGNLSDPHHGGHSVLIVGLEDGSRVVYKPKDLRVDALWHALVERMNRAGAPIELKAVLAIARDGYGWTEYIEHTGCDEAQGCGRFFRRAGAWLALFHCFAGTDIHQENMIAAGDYPVPIDLETILQAPTEQHKIQENEAQAFEAVTEIVANSVMAVGLLPAYGRSADNNVFVVGGVASDWTSGTKLAWRDINSDKMRPAMVEEVRTSTPNMPHVDGRYAKLGDHIDDFISGFEAYAKFLLSQSRDAKQGGLFDGFAGLSVRKVVRPTQFYYLLLQRLRNHRMMDEGVLWSAQADFLARLADWAKDCDPVWPLLRAERAALFELNVPHFVLPSDGTEICDTAGISARTETTSGLERARARVRNLDEQDIAWQIEVIRQNSSLVSSSAGVTSIGAEPEQLLRPEATIAPTQEIFLAEADSVAEEVSRHAIRRGSGAAWIGLGWLGDAEVSQLAVLGPDLYNGACGIAVFLAAHAMATERTSSADLALAAVSHLRKNMRSRNAARMARSLGIGGATGLGSIVYALTVMSKLLHADGLLADAHAAAELISDDLIAADKQLDVIGGSAGAILCLLRLHRDTQSDDVLKRALKCGEHLLAQARLGPEGRRSWRGPGPYSRVLNGMSHGAAGFAYALASLAAVTSRQEFANAASECIAFENASYDAEHTNWPDFRDAEPHWRCQWCHGAVGIGLARIAMTKRAEPDSKLMAGDIRAALAGAARGWPGHVDTLCCGTLGSVEFFGEAGRALGRSDLCGLASRRLTAVLESAASTGDYRWNVGERRFNLGLFRGLAGVGYTCLRQVAGSLPNVLIWD